MGEGFKEGVQGMVPYLEVTWGLMPGWELPCLEPRFVQFGKGVEHSKMGAYYGEFQIFGVLTWLLERLG